MEQYKYFDLSKKSIRHKKIMELLVANESMSNTELCAVLKCSPATIRNDLRELDAKHLIKRTFGSASIIKDAGNSSGFYYYNDSLSIEKQAISHCVTTSGILVANQSIVLDIGTTCYTLAQHINQLDIDLGVTTNSLTTASAFATNPHINLTVPGGVYERNYDSFETASAMEFYKDRYYDIFFLGVVGISRHNSNLATLRDLAIRLPVKQLLAKNSSRVVLLCDHSKINISRFQSFGTVTDIVDLIITDDGCSEEERSAFLQLGPPVIFAPIQDVKAIE